MLFVVCVGGFWLIAKLIGNALFPDKHSHSTFVDKTTHVHHHYYDNRSINIKSDEFKNLKR